MSCESQIFSYINQELRRRPTSPLQAFRIYIYIGEDGLPKFISGEWATPEPDRHLTVQWLPCIESREVLLQSCLVASTMIWNLYMSTLPMQHPLFMESFQRGMSYISALETFKTI